LEIYLAALPLVMSGRTELLDDERLKVQLLALERRTTRNGRDVIDHPPGRHDDLANAVARSLVLAAIKSRALVGLARSRGLS
jgi:hypothetical protein